MSADPIRNASDSQDGGCRASEEQGVLEYAQADPSKCALLQPDAPMVVTGQQDARLLQRRGLSLRREVVDLLPKLYTRPCDICMYVRLPDKRKDLNSLHDALWSIDGRV